MSHERSREEIVQNFHDKGLSGIMEVVVTPAASTEMTAIASNTSLQKQRRSPRKNLTKEVRSKKKQDKKSTKP